MSLTLHGYSESLVIQFLEDLRKSKRTSKVYQTGKIRILDMFSQEVCLY